MATSPYRVRVQAVPDASCAENPPCFDLARVAAFVWMVTLVRIVAAFMATEAPNREIDVAWLILLLAPVVIWKEWARHGRR